MGDNKQPKSFSLTDAEVEEVDQMAKRLGFRGRGPLVLAWMEATKAIPLVPDLVGEEFQRVLRPAKKSPSADDTPMIHKRSSVSR